MQMSADLRPATSDLRPLLLTSDLGHPRSALPLPLQALKNNTAMHLSTIELPASPSAPVTDKRPRSPQPALTDIAIVGLGYVGLPLSLQFARSGIKVLGLDIDPEKVDMINTGRSYIKHIPEEAIADELKTKRLEATVDFSRVKEVQAVIICVPTPLNKNREPDISYIVETGRMIGSHLQKGTLVVLGVNNLSRNDGRGFARRSRDGIRPESW